MVCVALRLDSLLSHTDEAQNRLLITACDHSSGLLYRKTLQIDEAFNKESFGKIGPAGGQSQAISSGKERQGIP